MKKFISKNYLLNRYSYILFSIFISVYIIYLKNNKWRLTKNDIIMLSIGSCIFFLWIFVYASFHFNRQVKVERIGYQSIKLTKGFESKIINQNDLNEVKFYRILNHKTGISYYKVLMKTKQSEIFGFSYQPMSRRGINTSLYDTEMFYEDTDKFWGLVSIDKIYMAKNFLECN